MSETHSTTFHCDLAGCDTEHHDASEYPDHPPENWIYISSTAIPLAGFRQGFKIFCTWEHAARYCTERVERKIEQAAKERAALRERERVRQATAPAPRRERATGPGHRVDPK